jgi:hypothetical protein
MTPYQPPIPLPSPYNTPTQRDDIPRYPPLIQIVRVSSALITASGFGAVAMYECYTQQVNMLVPRDREPAYLLDVNSNGYEIGTYLECRLVGTYNNKPLYAVAMGARGGGGGGGMDPLDVTWVQYSPDKYYDKDKVLVGPCTTKEVNGKPLFPGVFYLGRRASDDMSGRVYNVRTYYPATLVVVTSVTGTFNSTTCALSVSYDTATINYLEPP